MAINVTKNGNLLVIDNGTVGETEYWNSSWVSISFDNINVVLLNNSILYNSTRAKEYKIPMVDFEFGGTPYTTEATIVDALASEIG